MHDVLKVDITQDIMSNNDRIAELVNKHFTSKGIFTINVLGGPGVGKTTVIRHIIKYLTSLRPYVIEGDIESDLDVRELKKYGIDAVQINTFGACHLDAPSIHNSLTSIELNGPGVMFIENVGNLVCPAEYLIGEHCKLLICSVSEGSDKPYKYPLAFERADMIILNKTDLLPYLDFDEEYFLKGVRLLNKISPVFKVSGKLDHGFKNVADWINQKAGCSVGCSQSNR